METIKLQDYSDLPAYPGAQAAFFNAVSTALPTAIHPRERDGLVRAFVNQLRVKRDDWPEHVRLACLQALKALGRNPIGSEYLANDMSLSVLLSYASLPSHAPPSGSSPPSSRSNSPTSSSVSRARTSLSLLRSSSSTSPSSPSTTALGSPQSLEAVRLLANCLLLHESAREGIVRVGGAEQVAWALATFSPPIVSSSGKNKAKDNEDRAGAMSPTAEITFILGRILFLATLASGPFITALVEDLSIIAIIVQRIANPFPPPLTIDPTPELLKLAFNVLLHYPRRSEDRIAMTAEGDFVSGLSGKSEADTKVKASIGDFWDVKLDCLLDPLLQLLCGSLPPPRPSTSPALIPLPPVLTQTIQCLLAFPVAPLRSIWAPSISPSSSASSNCSSPAKPSVFSRLSSSANVHHSNGSSTSLSSASPLSSTRMDVASALLELVKEVTRPWEHPSDDDLRGDGRRPTGVPKADLVEECLPVLFLVLARVCGGNLDICERVADVILPDTLDRSEGAVPLERRSDLLGRLLRLLVDPNYTQTMLAVGELLWALAGKNASVLSELVGYGNAAGFLFTKGVTSQPPPPPARSKAPPITHRGSPRSRAAQLVDPITGLAPPANQVRHDAAMTDEEKEREAERLFVLFEKLERNPLISLGDGSDGGGGKALRNPVREAAARGDFARMDEKEERERKAREEEEDRRDEEQAIREIREVRARRGVTGQQQQKR